MPRQVDHDARRSTIAEAVCELIAERGIGAATLRETADRAGVSMGAVQRAFSKDGMLRCALDHIAGQIKQRADARIAASPEPESARMLLTVTLQELVLADQVAARVWLAFLAHAATRTEFADVIRTALRDTLALIVWLLEYGQGTGEIRDDIEAPRAALALQALVDGLTQHVVLGHSSAETAYREIDAAVRELSA